MLARLHLAFIATAGLFGCGSAHPPRAEPAAPTHETTGEIDTQSAEVAPEVVSEDVSEGTQEDADAASPEPPAWAEDVTRMLGLEPGLVAEWVAYAAPPPYARDTPGMRDYLSGCEDLNQHAADGDPPYECWSTLARSAGQGWVAIEMVATDSVLPESFRVYEGDSNHSRVLLEGGFGAASLRRLRRIAREGRWGTTDNLVTHEASETFSLSGYSPYVRLGGDLAGWHLILTSNQDIDTPLNRITAISAEGQVITLGEQPARLGACGDHVCGDDFHLCSTEELRAEGRLCVLPEGIVHVSHHNGELAVLGKVSENGHGRIYATHWFLRLPSLD